MIIAEDYSSLLLRQVDRNSECCRSGTSVMRDGADGNGKRFTR